MGPASDVYGLGATLFEILTGLTPHEGKDTGEMIRWVADGGQPRPEINQAVGSIGSGCDLREGDIYRPEDRYASASALAEDLQRWIGDEPLIAYRRRRLHAATSVAQTSPRSPGP